MVPLLWLIFYCALCLLFSITNPEPINTLPGQPEDFTLKQYSGYILTDDLHGRYIFYYFVEAKSKQSPTLIPLTLWLGGASSCSSVGKAMFTENGPFWPTKDGKLTRNKYSWNLESHMLYVDSPVGTGFSYSNAHSDYKIWNHTMTVNQNMKFLVKWFEKFPKYKNSDFYLGGDASGGHLAPQLAALVIEYNKNNVTPIKLKGLAIGNLGIGTPLKYMGEFLWYHGVISQEFRSMLKTVCSAERAFYEGHRPGIYELTKDCKKMMVVMDRELDPNISFDSLLSPECVTSNSSASHHVASEDIIADPCLSDYTKVYINRLEVQKALHINNTHLPYKWDVCEGHLWPVMDAYSTKNFHTLLAILKRDIRILLYSGDQDINVPTMETRKFANMLAKNLKLIHLQKNRPWYNGPQVGGWSEAFGRLREGKNVTYLTFASVKGGSHFTPSTNPSEAFTLFKSFLKSSPLKVGGWSEAFGRLREGKNVTYLTFASVKGGSHFTASTSPFEVFTLFKSFLKSSSLKLAH